MKMIAIMMHYLVNYAHLDFLYLYFYLEFTGNSCLELF